MNPGAPKRVAVTKPWDILNCRRVQIAIYHASDLIREMKLGRALSCGQICPLSFQEIRLQAIFSQPFSGALCSSRTLRGRGVVEV